MSDIDALTPAEIQTRKARAPSIATTLGIMGGAPLMAKGDSWFDFPPGLDVIDNLRELGYRISNYSRAGDTLENMILGSSVDEDGTHLGPGVSGALSEIASVKPKYFLFSGGGNDLAGAEFATYLNHASVSEGGFLREVFLMQMVAVFKQYIEILLKQVKERSQTTKLVMHGYAHAQPSGKATKILIFKVAGPWLLPSLQSKAIPTVYHQKLVGDVIDCYNSMLAKLQLENPERFLYIDIRKEIRIEDWRDELHLKNSAYQHVAKIIAMRLKDE